MASTGALAARSTTGCRGQSSVVGVVLVVGITVLGVTGITLFGTAALDDAQTRSEINAAEHAMTQLDSRFSLVALGSAEYHGATVDLESGSSMHVDGGSGWMNVSVVNQTTDEVDLTVLNASLGAVVYENDGTTIAYQGGGVWKRAPSGASVMVSPPEFHYRTTGGQDPTLTLPLVVVRGSGSLTERAEVAKGGTIPGYPVDGDPERSNPLTGGQINVTVHSEYYEAWGAFFEERTGGTVTYDDERQLATITLRIEQSSSPVTGGIVSGAAGTTLEFKNQAETDSYNSSDGSYEDTSAENTSLVVAGNFDLRNQAVVHGDLVAGGSVTLDNNAEVTGDVGYGGTLVNNGVIGGTTDDGANVAVPKAVDWLIDDVREDVESSNDNAGAADVSGNSLVNCDSPRCTLDDGRYYLDDVNLGSGDHLLLDTSAGDVTVVVDGDASLGDSKVEVVGGNTAKFYVEGDTYVGGSGNVTVADERAPGMWFYMNPGATFTFGNGARFVGVVYGPGSGAQDGVDLDFENHVTIYGGVVGDVDYVDNHIDIHFDEALTKANPLAGYAGGQPTVTYMHVSVNEVTVTDR